MFFWKKVVFLQSSKNNGAVAQLVEQRTENPCVGSSILSSTTTDGPLAQLNRAFDYGSKGCRFESCMGHKNGSKKREQFCSLFSFFQKLNLFFKTIHKKFVLEWLIKNGFQGKEKQHLITIANEIANNIFNLPLLNYIKHHWRKFIKSDPTDLSKRIKTK